MPFSTTKAINHTLSVLERPVIHWFWQCGHKLSRCSLTRCWCRADRRCEGIDFRYIAPSKYVALHDNMIIVKYLLDFFLLSGWTLIGTRACILSSCKCINHTVFTILLHQGLYITSTSDGVSRIESVETGLTNVNHVTVYEPLNRVLMVAGKVSMAVV